MMLKIERGNVSSLALRGPNGYQRQSDRQALRFIIGLIAVPAPNAPSIHHVLGRNPFIKIPCNTTALNNGDNGLTYFEITTPK